MLAIIVIVLLFWAASAIAWKAKQEDGKYMMNECLSEFGFGSYREKMRSGCMSTVLKLIAGIIGGLIVLLLCK